MAYKKIFKEGKVLSKLQNLLKFLTTVLDWLVALKFLLLMNSQKQGTIVKKDDLTNTCDVRLKFPQNDANVTRCSQIGHDFQLQNLNVSWVSARTNEEIAQMWFKHGTVFRATRTGHRSNGIQNQTLDLCVRSEKSDHSLCHNLYLRGEKRGKHNVRLRQ